MTISLIEWYRNWLRARGMTKWSVQTYGTILRSTVKIAGGERELLAATEEDIERIAADWLTHMKTPLAGWRPAVNLFYTFLVEEGLRQANPLRMEVLKRLEAEIRGTKEEQEKAKDPACADELARLRDRVIFLLLSETGLRPNELRVMALGCYHFNLGRLAAGPRRHVFVTGETRRALEEYLSLRKEAGRDLLSVDSLLFPDLEGGGMLSEGHYWNLIRRALRVAEFERETGTRSRVSYARDYTG
jgi:site-specific recombinase XerD